MRNIIRWQGLVGFIAVIGLFLAITLVFLDSWIKIGIESSASQATGAEVNIGSVSHRFSPLGLTVKDIQITDPARPAQNSVQLDSISADIELMPLFMSKIIIDELAAKGVKFNQPRSSEGKVYRQPEQSIAQTILPDAGELPSVDDILANTPLKTTKAIDEAQSAYQLHSDTLQQQYDSLPDKAQLKDYQTRIKALTDTDYKDPAQLAAAKQKFDQLKDELKQQQQKFKDFKQAVETAKSDLSRKLAALKAAPGQDYDLLKGLVAGDAAAYSELTQAIFGEQAKMWSETLFAAYDLVAPMLASEKEQQIEHQRSEGRWIEFNDTQPLPDFLIRKADISVSWQQQDFISIWQDITSDHDKLGRPTTFTVDSSNTPLWQSLRINGDLWLAASGVKAHQKWDLQGVKLSDMPLAEKGKLITSLQSALLASQGQLNIVDNIMQGNGSINLDELAITAQGENKLTNMIADSLRQLSAIKMDASIDGSIDSPNFSLNSDLDNQIAKTLTANVSGEAKQKLDELQQKLNAKASGPLSESNIQLSQWLDWEKLADGNLQGIEDMLGAQLNNVIDKKKDELKNKLKDKLFGN
ncbi:TIGR03545 family protein [Neptunicella sp. SCSIO 80796]|uniref:TIGR03545 family protein n=1 Tax=Neptunicella plasticusilytica TaxID=3117012 RepID=UPI003A4E3468